MAHATGLRIVPSGTALLVHKAGTVSHVPKAVLNNGDSLNYLSTGLALLRILSGEQLKHW